MNERILTPQISQRLATRLSTPLVSVSALAWILTGIAALAAAALPPTSAPHVQVDCTDAGAGTDDCELVEVTCYREVTVQRCRTVTEKKPVKKIVYDYKDIPYCQHRTPRFLQRAGESAGSSCPQCEDCPRYKRVLLKREIVVGEKSEEKCVVYNDVQWVPYVELRRVPRGTGKITTPAPEAGLSGSKP